MENTTVDYIEEYQKFQDKFRLTEVSGEEVGILVFHLATYYARYNVRMGDALRAFSIVKASFQSEVDGQTGKAMSSAKAETMADATDEAYRYHGARIHVQNIEQMLNAAKSLQKGVLFEYANSN